MNKTIFQIALLSAAVLAAVGPGRAELPTSTNLSGVPGVIDMPSGEAMPDGWLGMNYGVFGPISRSTLSFQITPRLSGSFRYVGIRDWNAKYCPPKCEGANAFDTYYDRNFDLRYKVLDESQYLPSVTVGLQDFIGTGLSMAEYVAVSKSFGDNLRLTGGLGFGRLASYGAIGSPFGERPPIDFGNGGTVNWGQWFRGDVAPFGGLEYKFADKWVFKAEYSSDAYTEESTNRETFDRKSPLNFGIEYQNNAHTRLGAYAMYGSEIGVNLTILMNPAQRPMGGVRGPGPIPIKARPPRSSNPEMYITTWVQDPTAKGVLINSMNKNLEREAIIVESLSVTGASAEVRFRNTVYDASAQAVGRVARAMAIALPSSIDVFHLVPISNGLAGAKVSVRRSDLERLEFSPDPAGSLRAATTISAAGPRLPDATVNADLYPKFSWSLLPWSQGLLFDPKQPIQYVFGAALNARYELASGLFLSGSVTQALAGRILPNDEPVEGALPPVRSRAATYFATGETKLSTLTVAYYDQLGPQLYGRMTAGYLEQMFGGISAEVLYQPVNTPWAIGADLNYVAQRDTDGGFGFDEFDYRVATGHVSGYYDFGNGYEAQLDVGRYLAGDYGGTLTLMRSFRNGMKVGAFATITNVSAEEFGEGSFDKGIRLDMPLTYFTGQPSRRLQPLTLRPLGRDGGARLRVNDRLRSTLRGYNQAGLDNQWGRFWK
ncbi:MAG: YjbH domain-containing protein [Alphaproteobacteria bacterium]